MQTVITMQLLLVSKEHSLALAKTVLLGDTMFGGDTLLTASGQSQLAKERNGLPIPVQHQDVILVHDRIIATPNCLHKGELLGDRKGKAIELRVAVTKKVQNPALQDVTLLRHSESRLQWKECLVRCCMTAPMQTVGLADSQLTGFNPGNGTVDLDALQDGC